MRHPWRSGALALALCLAAHAGTAADLVEVWQAAERHDRSLAVAAASHAAAQPRRAQADALWRPSVGLSASLGVGGSDTDTQGAQFSAPGFGRSSGVAFATSVNSGTAQRVAITAVQPLYNPQRRAQQQQLGLSVDAAELAWLAARQALMQRTVERYFDLALADETLRVQQRQLDAVQRATDEALERFRLGSAPVTDTYEAQARLGGVRAQRLAADTDLQLRRRWLADSTGLPVDALQARLPQGPLAALPTLPLDRWLADAEAGHPGIRQRRLALEIARQEAAKHSQRASATVDLVAQVSRDRLSGHGDFGSASNAAGNRSIGVQLNLPLFTGGMRDARQLEALRQADQAEAELDELRQQVAQQVRSAWLGLSVGHERLLALAQALQAAEARRDATELGRQVGHRTTLDQLNAENDRAAAHLALVQARVAVLMARLQLSALAGQLDEEQLRLASLELAPAPAP